MTENKTDKKRNGLFAYPLSQTHISWILTAIFLGFLVSIIAAKSLQITDGMTLWLASGCGLSLIAVLSRLRLLVPIAVLAGSVLGIARAVPVLQSQLLYNDYIDTTVQLRATVADDPNKIKTGTSLSLISAETANHHGVSLPGKIWVSIKGDLAKQIKRHDEIELSGELADGFGNYNASIRSAKLIKIIKHPGNDPMGQFRDNFATALAKVFNVDELNLGMGILTGQKSGLDIDVKNAFMAASLTHILVASGYNLTVLTRFARRLFARKSRLLALIFSTTFILLFAGITGDSASMSRAVMVALFSLITWYYGRRTHPVVLLSFVAFLSAVLSPSSLWGDAGWYMSFGSFAGVIIVAPIMAALFTRHRYQPIDQIEAMVQVRKEKEQIYKNHDVGALLAMKLTGGLNAFGQIIIETISTQIMTLPVIAYFMGQVSVIGLATNLLVLPLLPLTMLLTFASGLMAWLLPLVISAIVAIPAKLLLDFINGVAEWGAGLPNAMIEFQPTIEFVVMFYLVMIITIWLLKRLTGHNFYNDNVIK